MFVINLENQGFDAAWGADSDAPYLSETLRAKGVLLSEYYAIAHHSAPNYIAQISGQASNPMTRNDCGTYDPFVPAGTAPPGQVDRHRLRLSRVGADRRGATQCGRQDLEGLHGGDEESMPAP